MFDLSHKIAPGVVSVALKAPEDMEAFVSSF